MMYKIRESRNKENRHALTGLNVDTKKLSVYERTIV